MYRDTNKAPTRVQDLPTWQLFLWNALVVLGIVFGGAAVLNWVWA